MKPRLFLALIAVAIVTVLASVLLLSDDSGDSSLQGVTSTVIPLTMQPSGLLPIARWTEIDPVETMDAGTGDFFLLDTLTGTMYSPVVEHPDPFTQIGIDWLNNGQVSVHMYGSGGGPTSGAIATYVGDFLGPMTHVPGSSYNISANGILAVDTDDAIVLYDVAGGKQVGTVTPRPVGSLGGWSPDGRYLAFHAGNSQARELTMIRIWDSHTRKTVAEVPGTSIWWLEGGRSFLYGVVDPGDGDERILETRLLDLAAGKEKSVSPVGLAYPSPDGRYAIGASFLEWEKRHSFSIYEVSTGKQMLTLGGSWPMSWIDEDTIALMGAVCGPSTFYTVNVDGSNLRRHRDFEGATVAHASPNGDRFAFTTRDEYENPTITTIVDTSTGLTREFVTGGVSLSVHAMGSKDSWSPDGRYLVVYNRGGRDGPCFETQPQTFQLIRHP